MTKKLIRLFTISCFVAFAFTNLYGETSAQVSFAEGCSAYAKEDWDSAVFLLKKAVGYSENVTPETYYMLITSQMNAGANEDALDYCEFFLNNFSSSMYASRIQYFRGRILYNLGEYERSILDLSDFCHQYESDDMYPNALFYIAEALYAGYQYDEASSIYERIVTDFPASDKAVASQYRIDSIAQRSREEKLLYLLKQTGEEYLSAKEEYEKQLKMYNSESVYSARQRLIDAQQKNADLERQISEMEKQIEALNQEVAYMESQKNEYAQQAARAEEENLKNKALVQEQNEQRSAENAETVERLQLLKQKALEAQRRYEETE